MTTKIEKRRRPRSKSKPQSAVPGFLLKTYEILEDPIYHDIISWNEEGDAFIVKNVTEFSDKVLPKYFKHNNFASFVRQLNMYDFHKIRHESNENEFQHPLFKQGEKELLADIKRKTPDAQPEESTQLVPVSQSQSLEKYSKEASQFSGELELLKTRQTDLEKVSQLIIAQNSKLLKENKLLWSEMMKNKERYERKIEKIMLFVFSMMHSHNNPKSIGPPYENIGGSDHNGDLPIDMNHLGKEDDNVLSKVDKKKDHEKFYKQIAKYFQNKGGQSTMDRLMDLAQKGYFAESQGNHTDMREGSMDPSSFYSSFGFDNAAKQGKGRTRRNNLKQIGGIPDDDIVKDMPTKFVKTEAQSRPVPNLASVTHPDPIPSSESYPPPVNLEQTYSFPSLSEFEPLKMSEPESFQSSSVIPYTCPSPGPGYNFFTGPPPQDKPESFLTISKEPSESMLDYIPDQPLSLPQGVDLSVGDDQDKPQSAICDSPGPLDFNGGLGIDSPGPSYLPNPEGFDLAEDVFQGD